MIRIREFVVPAARLVRIPVFTVIAAFGAQPASVAVAQSLSAAPQLIVHQLGEGEQPVLDGHVDEAIWTNTDPFSAFVQQEPNDGQPATERTEIRFLLDRQNLYIGVICFDAEPDNILVSQSRRDADLDDTDSIQILLDTFNDGQNAFVFGTNPFGIEYDGQVMGGQKAGPAKAVAAWIQSELGRRLDRAHAR